MWWYFQSTGSCTLCVRAPLSAAELAPTYAPELNVVGSYANAPLTNVVEAIPSVDCNLLAVLAGYLLRGIRASYPETEQAIWDALTPRGVQMLDRSGHTCLVQGGGD